MHLWQITVLGLLMLGAGRYESLAVSTSSDLFVDLKYTKHFKFEEKLAYRVLDIVVMAGVTWHAWKQAPQRCSNCGAITQTNHTQHSIAPMFHNLVPAIRSLLYFESAQTGRFIICHS